VVSHRGKVHDYLGMIFDYSRRGKVMGNMMEYTKNIILDFPEEIIGMKASPATNHLFEVQDPTLSKLLPKEQAWAFHHAFTQLLFLNARACRDIQLVVALLTTRVKTPDEEDWGKVKRVLAYLKEMLHMPLSLPQWWVDAAYAVHHDCKGHTGAGISLGAGMVLSYSWKQKINTKSSTEVGLVGVDNSLWYILLMRYLCKNKVTTWSLPSYIKIIWAWFYWKQMEGQAPQTEPNISRSSTFSSRTRSIKVLKLVQ
jgi:hypothetical protein